MTPRDDARHSLADLLFSITIIAMAYLKSNVVQSEQQGQSLTNGYKDPELGGMTRTFTRNVLLTNMVQCFGILLMFVLTISVIVVASKTSHMVKSIEASIGDVA